MGVSKVKIHIDNHKHPDQSMFELKLLLTSSKVIMVINIFEFVITVFQRIHKINNCKKNMYINDSMKLTVFDKTI